MLKKILLSGKTVWIVFILLSIVLVACHEQADTNADDGQMFSINEIQKKIKDLNPDDDEDEEILYGKEIFDKTNEIVPDNVGNELSCMSCHGEGGLSQDSPMVGVTSKYPTEHHDEPTDIKDRVNGCFVRSMNGEELDEDSKEMNAMVSYLEFISEDVDSEDDIGWRMDNEMEDVPEPDVEEGRELFDNKNCVTCHADDGSGSGFSTGPALWGDGSFNEAAGINRLSKAAGFIQNNMPKDKPGTLTDQEAADLAAYLLSHERPVPDPDEIGDYHLDEDRDYIFKDRREDIREGIFDWTELDSVVPKDD